MGSPCAVCLVSCVSCRHAFALCAVMALRRIMWGVGSASCLWATMRHECHGATRCALPMLAMLLYSRLCGLSRVSVLNCVCFRPCFRPPQNTRNPIARSALLHQQLRSGPVPRSACSSARQTRPATPPKGFAPHPCCVPRRAPAPDPHPTRKPEVLELTSAGLSRTQLKNAPGSICVKQE